MAVFAYRVARPDGSTLHGRVEGENESLVRAKLEAQGFLVFNLHRRGITAVKTETSWSRGKLPLGQFLVFNQELFALVKSGLPILRIWDLLIERAGHAGFQRTLRDVREDIRGGASASEALAKHPVYFQELYVATVKAGEQSGNLPEVLQRYIAYLKLMVGLRQKVTKAISYPIILIGIGMAVVGFLLTYVMPTFISVYGESAKTLPWATQVLLDMVTHAESWMVPAAIVAIGVVFGTRAYYATSSGQLTLDRLVLKLPLVGQIAVKHNTVQLTRTLGTILAGGTPLVDALQGARGAVSNRWVSQKLAGAVHEIREGATLAGAFGSPPSTPETRDRDAIGRGGNGFARYDVTGRRGVLRGGTRYDFDTAHDVDRAGSIACHGSGGWWNRHCDVSTGISDGGDRRRVDRKRHGI
ncbi:MAG: type II secretion system F family protein [Nitrospira sp.]